MYPITAPILRAIATRGGKLIVGVIAVLFVFGAIRAATAGSGRVPPLFALALLWLLVSGIRTAQSGVYRVGDEYVSKMVIGRRRRLPAEPAPTAELLPRRFLGHWLVLVGADGTRIRTDVNVASEQELIDLGWVDAG